MSHTPSTETQRLINRETLITLAVIVILWLVAFTANFFVASQGHPFDVFTALFSGLAFLALWRTLQMQHKETTDQGEVIQKQLQHMADTALSLKDTADVLRIAAYLNALDASQRLATQETSTLSLDSLQTIKRAKAHLDSIITKTKPPDLIPVDDRLINKDAAKTFLDEKKNKLALHLAQMEQLQKRYKENPTGNNLIETTHTFFQEVRDAIIVVQECQLACEQTSMTTQAHSLKFLHDSLNRFIAIQLELEFSNEIDNNQRDGFWNQVNLQITTFRNTLSQLRG
jgi:hypothetical protein